MTIELSLLLSGISVAFATFFGISNKKRNDKKDAEQETEERATANTLMMTKLENIADDVKDIKRDYKETRAEVQDLHDRVLIVEQSLKSYHKRLDGIFNLQRKQDKDTLIRQQASSSAIERKNKMQSPGSKHPQVS